MAELSCSIFVKSLFRTINSFMNSWPDQLTNQKTCFKIWIDFFKNNLKHKETGWFNSSLPIKLYMFGDSNFKQQNLVYFVFNVGLLSPHLVPAIPRGEPKTSLGASLIFITFRQICILVLSAFTLVMYQKLSQISTFSIALSVKTSLI